MNPTYKIYNYPLNLFIDLFGIKRLQNLQAQGFQETMDQVLDTLPERVKKAVLLRYREHKTYREIANAIGQSETTAGQLVSRGITLLRHPVRADRLLGRATADERPDEIPVGWL